jgi:hypothetical protein
VTGLFLQKIATFAHQTPVLARFRMKAITWDSNLCYNDPNLRWGNPGCLLEPERERDGGLIIPIKSLERMRA